MNRQKQRALCPHFNCRNIYTHKLIMENKRDYWISCEEHLKYWLKEAKLSRVKIVEHRPA